MQPGQQQPAGLIPGAAGMRFWSFVTASFPPPRCTGLTPPACPAAGFSPAMNPATMQALLGQGGQIQGMQGHAILAQRLAVLPAG